MLGIAGVILAPAVIGVFWGAPLIARELETGTFRLVWTQSITRARWVASKLALPGLAAIAVTEGLSLMYGWWAAPIGEAARLAVGANFPLGMGPFSLLAFDAHGIVPIGYAAFGFTLGVTAGVLLRRALPAMAVTLAIFAAVQVAMPLAIRPSLFPPAHLTQSLAENFSGQQSVGVGGQFAFALDSIDSEPGAWIFSSRAVNAAGQPVSVMPAACVPVGASTGDPMPCLASHGIAIAVTYQPTSRYWPIQWAETGIYLALALALAGFCYWRVGRRLPLFSGDTHQSPGPVALPGRGLPIKLPRWGPRRRFARGPHGPLDRSKLRLLALVPRRGPSVVPFSGLRSRLAFLAHHQPHLSRVSGETPAAPLRRE
ncbi:MAG: hypothetical protein JWM19_4082, partial [Actinomycetia bacterium]|nr:hypothetical protein [Actinomycetes bacterium]